MGNNTHTSHGEPARLVTVKTAAQMLGSTPATVADLCDLGDLPSGRLGDRIVIPAAAVTAYAASLMEAS